MQLCHNDCRLNSVNLWCFLSWLEVWVGLSCRYSWAVIRLYYPWGQVNPTFFSIFILVGLKINFLGLVGLWQLICSFYYKGYTTCTCISRTVSYNLSFLDQPTSLVLVYQSSWKMKMKEKLNVIQLVNCVQILCSFLYKSFNTCPCRKAITFTCSITNLLKQWKANTKSLTVNWTLYTVSWVNEFE